MDHIGGQTPQALFLNVEAHKLHRAFTAAVDITAGQPVKLNNAGAIVLLGAADAAYLKIGIALHSKKTGEDCTVIMKPFMHITAEAGAVTMVCGPVKYSGINATTGRTQYVAAADAATTQGFAIEVDGAAIGDQIEVVLI